MNKFLKARLFRLPSLIVPLILISFFFVRCDNGSNSVGPSEPGELVTLTITPDPVSMAIGATQQFVVVGMDADSNVVSVTATWSVVAGGGTISSLGMFTAGTVNGIYTNTVKATSGNISSTVTVNVNVGALASITVSPHPDTLAIGGTQTFTAVGKDASGNPVSMTPTWSIEAGGGTIDGSGLFTAGATPGTFTNTVQAQSGAVSGNATVVVNANPSVLTSVTITQISATLAAGGTQTFTAVGKDANGDTVAIVPTWSVVAGGGTIDATTGVFTAGVTPGTFTNTIQAQSGAVSGTATVIVTANTGVLANITITPNPALAMAIGSTQQFLAIGKDASGNPVSITPTWSVEAGGGTINSTSGLFTAGSVGGTYTNTVKATSGNISETVSVTVSTGALASISILPNPVPPITAGSTQLFTAVGKDASGNSITLSPAWSVVAGGGSIDATTGVFTAGTTPGTFANTVRATIGGFADVVSVTVTSNTGVLASIDIAPNSATLASGGAQTFTAVGKDASGNVVSITPSWSVVSGGGTIDATTGVFTAGTTPGIFSNTVQATSGSISSTATVLVNAGVLASIAITPNPVTLASGGTQTFTAVGKDASGNTVSMTPSWSVVSGGGTIDASTGVFTAGTTSGTFTNTVTATSGSISSTATVTVNNGALASITITPNPDTLAFGGAQTFTAVGKDASGNTVTITPVPSWSVVAGGGTINASTGVFTAGTTPGTFTNTVRATNGVGGSISGTATVVVNTGTLASITVTPNPDTLAIGGAQTFTAVGKDGSGNTVAFTPSWSVVASGGTINTSTGVFTAGTTPGTFTNTVRATNGVGGSISGTATVVVNAATLASITVTPDPDTLDTGGTRQFVAVGKDASGNVIAFTPSWSVVAGGGTIDGSGLFTAGFVGGTYTNTVRAFSGSISDSATVLVISTGPAIVNLGTAGNFVVLSKSAISTTGNTSVVGDMGVSPAAASFITGFTLSTPPTTFTTSPLVTGQVFASDYNAPTPSNLTTAISDMETAFTDAAGRTTPDFTELGAGDVTGMNLVPGLYKWGTGVNISAGGVTLTGGANAVWIFQIDQDLVVANAAIVTLSGGAQAKNIFWQVAGQVTLGTTVDFKGNILSQTLISFNTGAVLKGRALAQTAVTLNATTVTNP